LNNNKNNNKYVLLVDDEKDILFLYSECLKSDGYQTISFDNPIEALNYLNKNDNISNCSLVITDYKMPQMSGIDFIKKVREVDNDYIIKVILISAYIINSIFIDQNNKLKIHKIIEKPISLKVLETEIKMLIDES
jgi:response regulator RpfG family c-di-GMP phosphodiesterase